MKILIGEKMFNRLSRSENSTRNIITGFAGQILTLIAGFICRITFVQCLSSEYLGLSGLFGNILSFLGLAELGIGSIIGYELYSCVVAQDQEKIAAYVQWYGKAYRTIGAIIALLGMLFLPFLDTFIAGKTEITENLYLIYLLYLANTVCSYMFSYKAVILSSDQKGYIVSIVQTLATVIMDLLQAVFLILTHNFIIYIIIQIFTNLTKDIVLSCVADKQYPFINIKQKLSLTVDMKKSLMANMKAILFSRIGLYFINGTDSIIVSALNGLSAAGILSNFTLLTSALNNIIMQFVNGITSSVGNLNAQNIKSKSENLFWEIDLFCFWMFGWSALSFIFLANDIVKILFGAEYEVGFGVVVAVALNYFSTGYVNSVWVYKNTYGLFKQDQYIHFITGALNIVLSIALGKQFGVFGVVIATYISRELTAHWYGPYAVFKYGLNAKVSLYFAKKLKYYFLLVFAGMILYITILCTDQIETYATVITLKFIECIFVPNIIFAFFLSRTKEFTNLKNRCIIFINQKIKTEGKK